MKSSYTKSSISLIFGFTIIWETVWVAGELLFHLFEVIGIYMNITENMHEFSCRISPSPDADHKKKQGIARDIEWHSQNVRTALVHSKVQFVVHDGKRICRMAKRRHFVLSFLQKLLRI